MESRYHLPVLLLVVGLKADSAASVEVDQAMVQSYVLRLARSCANLDVDLLAVASKIAAVSQSRVQSDDFLINPPNGGLHLSLSKKNRSSSVIHLSSASLKSRRKSLSVLTSKKNFVGSDLCYCGCKTHVGGPRVVVSRIPLVVSARCHPTSLVHAIDFVVARRTKALNDELARHEVAVSRIKIKKHPPPPVAIPQLTIPGSASDSKKKSLLRRLFRPKTSRQEPQMNPLALHPSGFAASPGSPTDDFKTHFRPRRRSMSGLRPQVMVREDPVRSNPSIFASPSRSQDDDAERVVFISPRELEFSLFGEERLSHLRVSIDEAGGVFNFSGEPQLDAIDLQKFFRIDLTEEEEEEGEDSTERCCYGLKFAEYPEYRFSMDRSDSSDFEVIVLEILEAFCDFEEEGE